MFSWLVGFERISGFLLDVGLFGVACPHHVDCDVALPPETMRSLRAVPIRGEALSGQRTGQNEAGIQATVEIARQPSRQERIHLEGPLLGHR